MDIIIEQHVQAHTRTDQRNLLDTLIRAWSDTSPMLTSATGAYQGHPLTINFESIAAGTPEYNAWLDKLSIMERFNGRTFNVVAAGSGTGTVDETGEGDVRQGRYRITWPEFLGLSNTSEPAYRWAV